MAKKTLEFLFPGQSIVSNIGVYTTLSPKGFVAMEKENMLKVTICNWLFSSRTKNYDHFIQFSLLYGIVETIEYNIIIFIGTKGIHRTFY